MKNTRAYRCMPRPVISDGTMSLSCVQQEHIEHIRQWRNAQMAVLRQNDVISKQQQIDYFESSIWPSLGEIHPDNILLAVHNNDSLIGYGGLVHIAWADLRAEVSFLVEPALANSTEKYPAIHIKYLELISEFAFDDLQFNRLVTETYAIRTVHIQALESAGFVREGVMREHTIQNGVATDSIIHGRLSSNRNKLR